MPGGKERALRRQIRSVQSTKKITKAMELIAASRIVKAQQRVAAARPYSERITDVIRNLAAAGAGGGSPLLERARRGPHRRLRGRGRRPRPVAAPTTARSSGPPSASMQRQRAEGRQTRLITVGKKAQSYFRFRGWDIDQAYLGMSDTPTYEDARTIAELRGHPVRERRVRPGRAGLHAVPVGRLAEGRHPPVRAARLVDARAGRRRPAGRLRVRAEPAGDPRPAAAPLRRGPPLRRAARRGRRRSSPPSSGP